MNNSAPMMQIGGADNINTAQGIVKILEECQNHSDQVTLAALEAFTKTTKVEHITVSDCKFHHETYNESDGSDQELIDAINKAFPGKSK